MVGISANLSTKEDWSNTYKYVVKQSDDGQKGQLKARLLALRESRKMYVLKKGVNKPAEEQTQDDYELKDDPASPLVRSGLTLSEIDEMIFKLS